MAVAFLLALQAAPAAGGPVAAAPPAGIAAVDFDLATVGTAALDAALPRRCAAPDGETIVVCGRRPPATTIRIMLRVRVPFYLEALRFRLSQI